MAKNILIVESPAKAKTLKKYLGKDFEILASYGHVRDLIPKTGAVDPEHHFKMKYALIEKNEKHLDAIAKAMKQAENLYLATDPDREGEAISWHLQEILKQKKILKDKKVHRVVFYEITRTAVLHAVAHPRDVSMDLVNAQQARRALDYLVGFNLSPLLWKKIRRGLSAGRVQSPALRLIVEREEEIEKFISQEYWTIIAAAQSSEDAITFPSKLIEYKNKKLTQFSVTNETQAKEIKETLQEAAQGFLYVVKVEKKQRKRQPSAPFTTSTLQQEAARKLGFTTQRTMRIAQQLYEGIDVGEGSVGLITYMRTDSVNLAQEALAEIRAVIAKRYGEEFLPEAPREFKTKSKNAQEAHEAIRPTHPDFIPDQIKEKLTTEQYKLYDLIWKRTLACQMIHATLDTVAVDLSCGQGNRFRANGSVITNPGFMLVYLEDRDDGKPDEEKEEILPPLKEGEKVKLLNIEGHQHFTEPPPRYSEASLVKALEERGIGRPSTYASIISTLQNRDYVQLLQKRFHPTDVGRVVSKFLTLYFTKYVDYDFTANLEDELDAIARGEKQWVPVLEEFWQPFDILVKDVEANISRKEVTQEEINEACPKCQKPLAIRLGKRGRFIGCTAFPECDYTRNLDETAEQAQQTQQTQVLDRACPECKSPLQVRMGRYGKFIGCTGYPACKYIEPLEKPHDTQVPCPTCHEGSLLKRKSRYGKIFYSCSKYPTCRYAIWNEPLAESCPKCQWPILTVKVTKRKGTQKVCPQKECGYAEDM
ncbi:MAG: DNA topoisomerase I [Gammaproteobacteria bacterium RIFCSPLOWO2_02_FULL_38_11]|nr:MAG: DNA topoisomerase I [Gammaproteobacteria bacterium RIFCSPHIGHO2_02_FULL_38_33]OGT23455.1 MAG: DNA topoisomerase I [Gammaproteobacteria bacterium RIFCSPHIGHO2_12_38_15]OGT68297.1 MAG: DNA topoisomerase I [Gammaproteobacteria bacterium RIFCSPLOWO2_02_FULL_38_11]OGT77531.1 MAG: DNA topoisomerase I [Gammaproteobacteria bacterium RIFCSPLOWO2_12_FULL_38_14]